METQFSRPPIKIDDWFFSVHIPLIYKHIFFISLVCLFGGYAIEDINVYIYKIFDKVNKVSWLWNLFFFIQLLFFLNNSLFCLSTCDFVYFIISFFFGLMFFSNALQLMDVAILVFLQCLLKISFLQARLE